MRMAVTLDPKTYERVQTSIPDGRAMDSIMHFRRLKWQEPARQPSTRGSACDVIPSMGSPILTPSQINQLNGADPEVTDSSVRNFLSLEMPTSLDSCPLRVDHMRPSTVILDRVPETAR